MPRNALELLRDTTVLVVCRVDHRRLTDEWHCILTSLSLRTLAVPRSTHSTETYSVVWHFCDFHHSFHAEFGDYFHKVPGVRKVGSGELTSQESSAGSKSRARWSLEEPAHNASYACKSTSTEPNYSLIQTHSYKQYQGTISHGDWKEDGQLTCNQE